ncbi:hypothetical protein BJX61DRAFT_543722 [Aspergillus egyptiacus]|nr:hypothetical protein BJX61DRAFT_543722 [Aspergillus egyptiacus]
MAVNALPEAPSSLGLSSSAPSMNKRLPPLADRASLPYKLTNLSKQKLAREATAPDPDIRRCLSHFRLHVRSIEWAQQEVATKITSLEYEDDDESEEEAALEEHPDEQDVSAAATAAPTPVEPEAKPQLELPSPKEPEQQPLQVHFEVVTTEKGNDKDAGGIVDKGRRCLEKTQKPFWPSPGQCMPLRIAS